MISVLASGPVVVYVYCCFAYFEEGISRILRHHYLSFAFTIIFYVSFWLAYFEQGISRIQRYPYSIDSVFYIKILYCVRIPQFACCAIVDKACVDCKIQGSKHNEPSSLRKNMNLKLPKSRNVFWCNKWIDSLLPCRQCVRTGPTPRSGKHFDSLCI